MANFGFKEQAHYFEKKLNLPTNSYLDIVGEEHDYFFVVAGANRNEVLLALREAVNDAILNGETIEAFRNRFDEIVSKTGWDYKGGRNWRTRIIFDTNMYASYNKGRLKQHLEMADVMPYWEYRHNHNANPRPEHMRLNGVIRPAGDPFWAVYYPIKAYGCHCTVIAHDEADLKRMGREVSPPPKIEMIEKRVGVRSGNPHTVKMPRGYDAGFTPHNFKDLNQARTASVDKVLMQKMIVGDPVFVSKAVGDLLNSEQIMRLHEKGVAHWVQSVASAKGKDLALVENLKLINVLPVEVLQKLDKKNLMPSSAVIAMNKGDLLHALRALKERKGVAIPLSFWQELPSKLQTPQAVLMDKKKDGRTLLFIYDMEKTKLAIKIDYDATITNRLNPKLRKGAKLNRVVTGSVLTDFTGLGSEGYELLMGELL